jgi:predicted dehydrogenase
MNPSIDPRHGDGAGGGAPQPLSRRDFIQRSGAGLAAGTAALVSLPAVLPAGSTGKDDEVRLAWIGVGGRGSSLLREALNNVTTANLRVNAICDIDPGAREGAIKACAGMRPAGIDDYRKVLDRADVDAVVIATPVYLHSEMAVAAAQAGKNTYCEKPLGRNPKEVWAIHKAVKESKVAFQVGFQWRYDIRWQTAIQKVHDGEIGKVHFISASRHVGGYPDSGWYVDRELSGDLIVEQAVHEMNVFCWLMKGPPLRAAGFGGINALEGVPKGRSIMDHYSLSYEFPENVRLSYSHCVYTAGGIDGIEQMVMGRRAAVDLQDCIVYKDGKKTPAVFESLPNATGVAIASFVDCVRSKKEPLANVDAGVNATLMAVLGRIAIHEKRVAEWKEVAAS